MDILWSAFSHEIWKHLLTFNFNYILLPDESQLKIDFEEKVFVFLRKTCGVLTAAQIEGTLALYF